jgi:hypothetical protein
MIHRAAALADLFHPLCGQPGLLLWLVNPVAGDGFLDGLLGVGRLQYPIRAAGVLRMRVMLPTRQT